MDPENSWRAYLQATLLSGVCVFFLTWSLAQADEVAPSPYGPDDEIGVLNELTEANTLAVLQRVSSGRTYDLSVENFVGMPGLADLGMGDPPFHMWLTHTPRGMRVEQLSPAGGPPDLALYDDAYTLSAHTGTHIDALNHLGRGEKIFNGYDAPTYLSDKGWTKAGADTVPPIITRGVLIDVAGEKGVALLPPSYEITIEDLQRVMKKQGVRLQKNDAVLIRTGRMTVWPDPKKFVHNDPGITRDSAPGWSITERSLLVRTIWGSKNFQWRKTVCTSICLQSEGCACLNCCGWRIWPGTRYMSLPLLRPQSKCAAQPARRFVRLRCPFEQRRANKKGRRHKPAPPLPCPNPKDVMGWQPCTQTC